MSAIAARKARLASQNALAPVSSSDEAGPSHPSAITSPTPKRKVRKVSHTNADETKRQKAYKRNGHAEGTAQIGKGKARLNASPHVEALRKPNIDDRDGELDNSESDSSDKSSDTDLDVEEDSSDKQAVSQSALRVVASVVSTFVPIREGPRKNWHLAAYESDAAPSTAVDKKSFLVIGLKPGQRLIFVGKIFVKILEGRCHISGAAVSEDHHPLLIFAPQSSPLPVIEADSGTTGTCRAMPEYGLNGERFAVILQISSADHCGIDGISKICPLLRSSTFSEPSNNASSALSALKGFHPILQAAKGLVTWQVPPSWVNALSSIETTSMPVSCLVQGPKRTGKSTFSRYLLHRLVSTQTCSIAYLDTDLGQTEFGPPGVVALHLFGSLSRSVENSSGLIVGPSWASLRVPFRSHFLGDSTPRDDPATYVESIADLMKCYSEILRSKGIPLIVNTQGWVKGLGADLLLQLERIVQPTHIFDMVQHDEGEVFIDVDERQSGRKAVVVPLEAISPALTRDRGLNTMDVRTLTLVSYFYSIRLSDYRRSRDSVDENEMWPRWDFSSALVQQRPYIIRIPDGLPAGVHILPKGASVQYPLQLMALNGSCVAIVEVQRRREDVEGRNNEDTEWARWTESLTQNPPALYLSRFVALAIVRSIDVANATIHLLTPMSPASLSPNIDAENRQLCLVKGAIEVPVWLSLDYSTIEATQIGVGSAGPSIAHLERVPLTEVPYLDFDAVNTSSAEPSQIVGLGRRKVRRNILRRSQNRPI